MEENRQQIRRLIARTERHMDRAERDMDREEWDEVAELCYQALALDPYNENAANKLRLVYLPFPPVFKQIESRILLPFESVNPSFKRML